MKEILFECFSLNKNFSNNNAGHNSKQIEQQIDVLEEEEVEETVTLETIYVYRGNKIIVMSCKG